MAALDVKELLPVYRHYKDQPVISISRDQRRPLPENELGRHRLSWLATQFVKVPVRTRRLFGLFREAVSRETAEPGHRDCPSLRNTT
jgi:hypothetical protein